MKEARIGGHQALIAHNQTAEMAKPGERPFHDPPPAIPPQLAPILMRGVFVVAASRDDRLDPPPGQPGPQRIAVIAPIRDQSLWSLAGSSRLSGAPNRDRVERPLEERDFRWGSCLQVCSQRSTRAIDQNHPLCALAPLGCPDLRAPFFAGMKLPSAKHSSQRSFCWSLSWAKKARHSLRSTPVFSHSLSRRQQVLGLPYRLGSSLHGAPVHRIQRMPSKRRRASRRGRPPRGDTCGCGRWTRITCHCCVVSPRHAMLCLLLLLGNSWRDDTPTGRF
jgi:hypothetical protein